MRTLAIVLCSFLLAASVVPASAQKKDEVLVLTDELFNASNIDSAAAKVWKWLRGEWGAPDPNRALDSAKNTFMHYAATINRLDILREAVRLGGDCNRRNAHGATPLHFAATQGDLGPGAESLRILMRCEAGPGVQSECARGDRTGKSCRADTNLRDGHGDTPLHALYGGVELRGAFPIKNLLGVSKGRGGARADILKFLLQEAKADPNIKNKKGDTPLRSAIRRVKSNLWHVSFLLRHGADPDTRNNEGVTPLFEALSESNDSSYFDYDMKYLSALLLKHGADPDLRDTRGDTPLIWAAKEAKHEDGLKQLMEVLLAGGADPCLRDRSGKLPIDYTLNGSSRQILLYKAGGSLDWATDICARDLLGAKKREKKLNLSRKVKREIQSCLEELKLAPGSTDGAFGPPTRKAIRAWQTREGKKGADAAGYLAGGEPDALLASAACKPPGPEPLCTGQTGSGCWLEYANRRGCYTWNPNPQSEETVTWSGECVDGRASGKGKRVWRWRQGGEWKSSSGEGEMRAGNRHGHWILRFGDGKIWEGSYADGKLHGIWVRHGEGEPARQCRENGEKVDMSACLTTVEGRAMEVAVPAELRHGPGDAFSQKANLASGEKVKVKAEAGEWALVETSGGITGFVQKSVLKEVAIVTEPKCVFGSDRSESEKRAFDSEMGERAKDELLVHKEIFKRGLVLYDLCWQEVANKPGCYIFHGYRFNGKKEDSGAYISVFFVPRPSIHWSGKCVNGVVHGRGKLAYSNKKNVVNWKIWPVANFVDGKRHEKFSLHYYHDMRYEGEWVNGLRQGKWVYTNTRTGTITRTENYLDGLFHGPQCKARYNPQQYLIIRYQHGKLDQTYMRRAKYVLGTCP